LNKVRHVARWRLFALVAVLAVTLVGCANVRRGVSWPALELVTINGESRVLVVYDGQINAIDPYFGTQSNVEDADGNVVREGNNPVQWTIQGSDLDGAQFFVSPFEENSTFLFPTYNNRMIEVDVDTAQVANANAINLTDGVIADIVVTDEFIYVPYRQENVVALDRETYAERWIVDTVEGVWAAPLLHEGVLYVASIDHYLYAVDAVTGTPVWDVPVDLEGAIASTPVFYEDHLYVGSYSHNMYKISLNGEIVDSYEGNNWVWGTPVIEDGILYYTDLSGYVYAIDVNDMTLDVSWGEPQRPANRGIRPAPLVTDNYVIVAARNGTVYWLDRATGTTVQQAEIEGRPELLSDILYIPADEERGLPELILVASTNNKQLVSALNMDTFTVRWVYQR